MGTVTICTDTTPKNPITIIGRRAGVCWGADISDDKKNYKRGLSCLKDNHGRTFEYPCVDIVLDGYSARVIREWYTHIGGSPTRLQESTRYINYEDIEHITPSKIKNNEEARDIYENIYLEVSDAYKKLIDLGIPKEDVANTLPLGMTTKVVDHRDVRNYIDMAKNRKCNRAYWEFRRMFEDICDALSEYSEEWDYLVEHYFKCKCDVLGYCPESHGCGKYPYLDTTKFNVSKLITLVAKFSNKHPLAKDIGGEYIYQDDEAEIDALELVSEIFDKCYGENNDERL